MGLMPDLRGSTLGQYEIRGKIGEGGMAAVYRAYQPLLDREVAIKVLPSALAAQDAQYEARFRREAATAAALEHPHIVPIIEYGTQDGISFVVMRLLKGGSLRDRIALRQQNETDLPNLTEVVALVRQIAAALDYAHTRNVIHRDIKPSNIMFDEAGSPYVVDFGIAKVLDAAEHLTEKGQTIGTPSYMAPEQWRAEAPVPATDQYAVGILTYALLTGHTPFESPTPYGLMHLHLNQPAPSLMILRDDLPPMVDDAIQRAIAKRPDDRYDTVTAFAEALAAAAAGHDSERTNFFTFPLPQRAASPDATFAAPVTPLLPDTPTTATRDNPPEPVGRRSRWWRQNWIAVVAVILFLLAIATAAIGIGGNRSDENQTVAVISETERNPETPATPPPAPTEAPPSPTAGPTPLEGPVFTEDETGVIVMRFSRTNDATADVEGNLEAALTDARVPFVSVNYALSGPLEDQRQQARAIADVYQATIVLWGTASPGGVRYYTEAIPRRSTIQTTGAESFTIALPPTELDIFLFESRNILYVVNFVDGQLAYFEGDNDRARTSFDAALEYLTPDLEADLQAHILYFFLGNLTYGDEDFATAIAWYDRANALSPENTSGYLNRGNAYRELEDYDNALADYQRALDNDPRSTDVYVTRGLLYDQIGEVELAIADYTTALGIDPFQAIIWIDRGLSYANLGENKRAIHDYNKAIQLDPDSELAFSSRAYSYADIDQYRAAIDDFTRAIELNPSNDIYYQSRAVQYFQLGDLEAAQRDLEAAIDIAPDNPFSYEILGLLLYLTDDTAGAWAAYERLLALTDDFELSSTANYIAELQAIYDPPPTPTLPPISDALFAAGDIVILPGPVVVQLRDTPNGTGFGGVCTAATEATVSQTVVAANGTRWVEIRCDGGTGWIAEDNLVN